MNVGRFNVPESMQAMTPVHGHVCLHEQATQARLAELEGVQRAAQAKLAVSEVDRQTTDAAVNAELENSSQKLEQMHLDDDDKQNEEPHPRRTEPEMSTA